MNSNAVASPISLTSRILTLLPLMLGLTAIVFAGIAILRPAQSNTPKGEHVRATDFSMPLYSHGTFHLATERGRTVVLNFWWSGCVPCQQEAVILQQSWERWRGRKVVFVGVDEQDTERAARSYLRSYGVTYANGADPGSVDIAYRTTGQPETFVISPNGQISLHILQPIVSGKTLDDAIVRARL